MDICCSLEGFSHVYRRSASPGYPRRYPSSNRKIFSTYLGFSVFCIEKNDLLRWYPSKMRLDVPFFSALGIVIFSNGVAAAGLGFRSATADSADQLPDAEYATVCYPFLTFRL